ncbi:MAG: hypothetical protein AB7I18_11090 [Candidatus Berkiella sp.]
MRNLTQNECGQVGAGAETVSGQLAIISYAGGLSGMLVGTCMAAKAESEALGIIAYALGYGTLGAAGLPITLFFLGNMIAFTYNVGFGDY